MNKARQGANDLLVRFLQWGVPFLPQKFIQLIVRDLRTADVASSVPRPRMAATRRILIGPRNSAGQAWEWGQALERHVESTAADALSLRASGGFDHPTTVVVSPTLFRFSREWQQRMESLIVNDYTHVIIESCDRLAGVQGKTTVVDDVARWQEAGVRVAALFHGSDIRRPSAHYALSEWSPFIPSMPEVEELEQVTTENARLAALLRVPMFVATPDLLRELPRARWLPNTVSAGLLETNTVPFGSRSTFRVLHAPTSAWLKGSDVIDDVLTRLHDEGVLEYVRVSGVPSDQMPRLYASVDIVVEQLVLGLYSTTACEGMAAGRLVVGHVDDFVRSHVREATGFDLPILEATKESLEQVIRGVALRPSDYTGLAAQGQLFARSVHSGAFAAGVLRDFLEG